MLTAKNIIKPYPGLRPFNSDEKRFFFGRDDQTASVIHEIEQNRFVALTGSSGSGKSSLINAGIIPGISEVSNADDGSSWKIITTRPGVSPIDNLSRAIAQSANENNLKSEDNYQPDKFAQLLKGDHHGLAELFYQIIGNEKGRILIIIDQFEELFHFRKTSINGVANKEHEDFISLLVEAVRNKKLPVHVLLAVNSDFLEDCYHSRALSNMILESNHKLDEFTADDLRQVIEVPAKMEGAEIDSVLVNQILRDITDKSDQLPLLQHLLNRMWDYWVDQNIDQPISLKEYDAAGGIENAVSIHADQAYDDLSDSDRKLCEKIFKTITGKLDSDIAVSKPLRIDDIAFINHSGTPEIIDILEKFRQPGRPFILPQRDVKLDPETVISLSHESLIRLWKRLRTWVEEEAESVSIYTKLAEQSRLFQVGKANLLTAPDLQKAILWREKNEPTFQWAQRHNTAFERTMQYLNLSQETYESNEFESYFRSRRVSRITRAVAVIAILIGVISAGILFYNSRFFPETWILSDKASQEEIAADEQLIIPDDRSPDISTEDIKEEAPGQTGIPPLEEDQASPGVPDRSTPPDPSVPRPTPPDPLPPEKDPPPPPATSDTGRRVAESSVSSREPLRGQNEVPGQNFNAGRDEAVKQRMVAISQSLAVRSLQVDNNPDLKALLAFQSYMFNEKYNGPSYNSDIYTSLIASIKGIYGDQHNVYKGHTESVNSVVFHPNSSIFYSASSDGQVIQWDINDDNKLPRTLIQNSVVNNQIAISPNGQWLAVSTEGEGVHIFNPSRNLPNPFQVTWGNNRVIAIDFYPDNEHIIFAGSDNSIVKYNIRSRSHEVLGKTNSEVLSLAVSSDGEFFAAGTRSGQVILYHPGSDNSPRILFNEAGDEIFSVAFNINDSRIAAGSIKGDVKIMDVSNGNLLATLGGHNARVVDVEFCPANKFIASSSFDGSVRIWNAQNFNSQAVILREHGSWVRAVAFNSKGNKMVTVSRQEPRIRVWTTDAKEMAVMICEGLTRNMTSAEWNQYIGDDIPYQQSCQQLSDSIQSVF